MVRKRLGLLERAEDTLGRIFGGDRRRHHEWLETAQGQAAAVLALLRAYPSLTLRSFHGMTPLCHFLMSKAAGNLQVIKAVHNSNPMSVAETGQGTTPLHVACISEHTTKEVVEFIYRKNRKAIMAFDHRGRSPPMYLFLNLERETPRRDMKLDTLNWLMELHPECVKAVFEREGASKALCHEARFRHIDLLASAMVAQCPSDVYDAIIQHYPTEGGHHFVVGSARLGGNCRMGLPEAQALCQILPRLKSLKCQPQRWTGEALLALLRCLAHSNHNLEELVLTLSREGFADNQDSGELLTGLFRTNKSLRVLKLTAEVELLRAADGSDGLDTLAIQGILRGLSGNQTLRELELSDFVFPVAWDTQQMGNAARQPAIGLKTLVLNNAQGVGNEMFRQGFLPLLPSLKKLQSKLTHTTRDVPDVTDAVLSLLRSPTNLQILSITGPKDIQVDARAVFQALTTNNILESIDIRGCLANQANQDVLRAILRNDNLTLRTVGPYSFGKLPKSTRIEYMLQLNQWGRKKARDHDTTKDEFVQLLDKTNIGGATVAHRILFGLLKERPELWAA